WSENTNASTLPPQLHPRKPSAALGSFTDAVSEHSSTLKIKHRRYRKGQRVRSTGQPNVYAQDLVSKMGKEVYDVLDKQRGYLYVCGDAKNVAANVSVLLHKLGQEYGGRSEKGHEVRQELGRRLQITLRKNDLLK
ncbi:hypothetical protein HDU79_000382, partial [Rhizoclosmatium sp. JEL0117]